MNGELFPKDQYGVHKCIRCGALGTIVEMGVCCRVKQLDAAWDAGSRTVASPSDFFEPVPRKRAA